MRSQHPKYGDASYMVFLVEETIFHVPNRRLKQSQFFREMIEETYTGLELEGKDNEHPMTLGGVSAFEMTSFLDVTESRRLDDSLELIFSQWIAALHLATMWGFDDIREKIIEQVDTTISAADPIDRIAASLKCRVEKWLHPAYVVLCKRDTGLSDAEAEKLGLRRSIAICRVRESLVRSAQLPSPPTYDPYKPLPPRQTRRAYGRYDGDRDDYGLSPPPPPVVPQSGSPYVIQSDAIALELIRKQEALKFS